MAACGLAGSNELPVTVYPFILRAVILAGIDAAWCPMSLRLGPGSDLPGPGSRRTWNQWPASRPCPRSGRMSPKSSRAGFAAGSSWRLVSRKL